MYCKDCKYWKFDRVDEILDGKYKVVEEFKRGECLNKNLRFGWGIENESQLIYHDSDDYSAYMFVGELFGCVHYKKIEES